MMDDDDVLMELDAALRVEPSRAFADGVRARVVRAQTWNRSVWVGLAAAACLTLTTLVLWRPADEAPVVVPVASTASEAAAPIEMAEQATAPAVQTSEATPRISRVASEPHLEVITNQGAVLRELWQVYRNRPLVEAVVEAEASPAPAEVKPIAVDPIVVAPLVISEIEKPGGSTGAAPVIRRVDATRETK